MTITSTTTHPNGVTFKAVAPYQLIPVKGGLVRGWLPFPDKHGRSGVWIEYNDGVRIFRPNEYYDHILPLKPSKKDIL